MNKSIFKTVLLLALVIILSSCSAIMSSMYGVKRIKRFNQQNYDNGRVRAHLGAPQRGSRCHRIKNKLLTRKG